MAVQTISQNFFYFQSKQAYIQILQSNIFFYKKIRNWDKFWDFHLIFLLTKHVKKSL